MRTILEIIERKKKNIDCSEEESAEVKGWLRELRNVGDQKIEADIQTYFPIEYGEWLDEPNDWTRDYSGERDHESYREEE